MLATLGVTELTVELTVMLSPIAKTKDAESVSELYVAVTVNVVGLIPTVGVPVTSPVEALRVKPLGSAGEIVKVGVPEKLEMVKLGCICVSID